MANLCAVAVKFQFCNHWQPLAVVPNFLACVDEQEVRDWLGLLWNWLKSVFLVRTKGGLWGRDWHSTLRTSLINSKVGFC